MCHREIFLFQCLVNVREEFFDAREDTLQEPTTRARTSANRDLRSGPVSNMARTMVWCAYSLGDWEAVQWLSLGKLEGAGGSRCMAMPWLDRWIIEEKEIWKIFFRICANNETRIEKETRIIKSYGEAYNHSLRYAE